MGAALVSLAQSCDECLGLDKRHHTKLREELEFSKDAVLELKPNKLACC